VPFHRFSRTSRRLQFALTELIEAGHRMVTEISPVRHCARVGGERKVRGTWAEEGNL